MLQIQNISKQYKTESLTQQALDNVSLNLRDNEFVAILGPSGSGKTTLLNIIGGLDRYDSGDLIINSISTKNYSDRDWDSYRNHTIGFVFQSYNLIPHQSILSNVELALTISGVSKTERKQKALEALEKVELGQHIHKRPNQLSGGQMQRVAIARALVNNPDILLADEPTGALDSTTSIQVMELLKEVAKDRLVVMVTHNPELAESYATRIVKLKDGKIIDDSFPYEVKKQETEAVHKNMGHSSMSLLTAFFLSANNLLTKKGRTILTAFAGSIGIIGIALILSLSNGFQNYIDQIQEDTLTSYPLTITSETADAASMLLSMTSEDEDVKDGFIKEQKVISSMFSKVGTNDLTSFKEYLESNQKEVDTLVSLTQYKYNVQPLIYTKNEEFGIKQLNPSTILSTFYSDAAMTAMSAYSPVSTSVFNEMIDDLDTLKSQYEIISGKWPEAYNEMILVLSDPKEISDMLVYSLGLRDSDELMDMMSKLLAKEDVDDSKEALTFSHEDFLSLPFKLIDASSMYKYNDKYNIYENMSEDEAYMNDLYEKSETLKIVGIVCPKEGSTSMSLSTGIAYTKELTEHVIEQASTSEIVQKQLANPDIDIFNNKAFDDKKSNSDLHFEDMISIDKEMLSSAFGITVNQNDLEQMTQGYMEEISKAITTDTSKAQTRFLDTLSTLSKNMLNEYIELNAQPPYYMATLKLSEVDRIVSQYLSSDAASKLFSQLESDYMLPKETFKEIYQQLLSTFLKGYIQMTSTQPDDPSSFLNKEMVEPMVQILIENDLVVSSANTIAAKMTEATMQKTILTKVRELTASLSKSFANAFNVDETKMAQAFKFDLSEEELRRLIQTMSVSTVEASASTNLTSLGYQDLEAPSSISFYFKDFESKELFMDFLDDYNEKMAVNHDEKEIKYTDITGILMSSVKVIVDSVSYVLIAFVSISLIVSSIMIGIITYISVLERTKEIGVLRAIGASKKNISSIFNAETFIIGLFSGLLGIGVTLALLPLINHIIHSFTNNFAINASLPISGAIILIILSILLTLFGGLIPSKQAAKKDPVTALRNE